MRSLGSDTTENFLLALGIGWDVKIVESGEIRLYVSIEACRGSNSILELELASEQAALGTLTRINF